MGKVFESRVVFRMPHPSINRGECEAEGVQKAIAMAGEKGYSPRSITVTRDDEFEGEAVSQIKLETMSM